jgi:hypothetical protein
MRRFFHFFVGVVAGRTGDARVAIMDDDEMQQHVSEVPVRFEVLASFGP